MNSQTDFFIKLWGFLLLLFFRDFTRETVDG